MTDHDITEIADARYMGLMCPPASPEAEALVADIINIIEQSEERQRARKAKDKTAFRSAVGLIVGDLLIAMEVTTATFCRCKTCCRFVSWQKKGLPNRSPR